MPGLGEQNHICHVAFEALSARFIFSPVLHISQLACLVLIALAKFFRRAVAVGLDFSTAVLPINDSWIPRDHFELLLVSFGAIFVLL